MKNINSSKIISMICWVVSALVFFAIYLFGNSLHPGDEMGYCVLDFYIIMPLTTLAASLIIGIKKGFLFWLYPVIAGLAGLLIPFAIFKTFNVIAIFFALLPALIGLSVGLLIHTGKAKS